MAYIKIEDLSFTYPNSTSPALDNISLEIKQGDFVVVCGRSGCGKTTLLKSIKSVLLPHGKKSGEVYILDTPVESMGDFEQAKRIGYVFQNPDSQIVTDKVWHEMAFGLENLGYDTQTIRLKVAEMASFLGISEWFHKDVDILSGGQKQLLNLASILVMNPDILILDEPTAQLDPIAAHTFINTVKRINNELGTIVLISEHRLEEVIPLADNVLVMDAGKVACYEKPRKVGKWLYENSHPMYRAMPTPIKLFYELAKDKDEAAPLNVREGISWLNSIAKKEAFEQKNNVTQIDKKDFIIELNDVWFRYDKNEPDVLKGFDLHVPRASIYSILGDNGIGKSTVLNIICNILKPYRGKLLVDGKKAERKGRRYTPDGVVMLVQDPQALFIKNTVEEELIEMLESESNRDWLKELIELLELESILNKHPFDISEGEKQRVGLCKVLLATPRVLILDEPTKGVDSFFKEKLGELFLQLKNRGVTVIFVSHDIEFCAEYSDRVGLMFDGKIISENSPKEFFSNNIFYTTAANKISRDIIYGAITPKDIIEICNQNM